MSIPLLVCTAKGCVLRPGHDKTCLPAPKRVTKCVPCHGRGNAEDAGCDFTCVACLGTGLAS